MSFVFQKQDPVSAGLQEAGSFLTQQNADRDKNLALKTAAEKEAFSRKMQLDQAAESKSEFDRTYALQQKEAESSQRAREIQNKIALDADERAKSLQPLIIAQTRADIEYKRGEIKVEKLTAINQQLDLAIKQMQVELDKKYGERDRILAEQATGAAIAAQKASAVASLASAGESGARTAEINKETSLLGTINPVTGTPYGKNGTSPADHRSAGQIYETLTPRAKLIVKQIEQKYPNSTQAQRVAILDRTPLNPDEKTGLLAYFGKSGVTESNVNVTNTARTDNWRTHIENARDVHTAIATMFGSPLVQTQMGLQAGLIQAQLEAFARKTNMQPSEVVPYLEHIARGYGDQGSGITADQAASVLQAFNRAAPTPAPQP